MTVKDLRQIVRRGEDSGVQFKLDVSSPDSLASEVVAFLNAKGGVIYIGVSDAGEIAGLDASGVRRVNQMISNVASQCIRNPVSLLSENIALGKEKVVIAVTVPEGLDKPYFDKSGVIWLKEGADKRRVASKEEVRRLFEASDAIHADERATKAKLEQLDLLRLRPFFEKIYGVPFPVSPNEVSLVVKNMNLATDDGRLNLAGLMMFGLHPESLVPQFCIKAARADGTDMSFTTFQDREDISGVIQDLYAGAMAFLMRNMRKVQKSENVNMPGESEIPRVVFEELVVNALVHSSYFIDAPIRIVIFDDRVEIISPGSLPNHLTVEKILAGNANIRNPVIASYVAKGVLPYWGLGSGIKRAKAAWGSIAFIDDKPDAQFSAIISLSKEESTTLKPGRTPLKAENTTLSPVNATLKTTLKTATYKVAELLIDAPGISIDSICKATGLSRDGVNYQIRVLKARAGLRRIGGRREGLWDFSTAQVPSQKVWTSSQGAKW